MNELARRLTITKTTGMITVHADDRAAGYMTVVKIVPVRFQN